MAYIPYETKGVILRASNVNVALGGRPILRDLNLEIHNITRPGVTQGQVVALLGPSGMGKTTLFRVLSGLDRPDSGEITVEEAALPVRRGMVGVVAQNYPLFMHRTVLGNLTVAGKQAGLSGTQCLEKAKQLLKQFGLEEESSKYPCQLSGGQRQRAAIVQQFMCSEHFLLMDEPFSGLDLLAIERVTDFICSVALSDELKTIIIVTHDVSAALSVADTVWLLGRDRDANGQPIPGARVQETYNLADRGLAWQKGIETTPEYLKLRQEIRSRFATL
jgi:polar amino acid transport system ATP-binding protein/sulfate transport system ATP-binding protein